MSRKMQAEDSPIRSILNAMDALEFIAQSRQGVGVRELARTLRMTPATAGRVLASLQASGMLDQDEETSRYFLGPRTLKIAADYSRSLNLQSIADKYLRELVEATGETVFLGVLDETEVVVVNRVDSPQPLRIAGELGTREPAHCTALGKVMLASRATTERDRLIDLMELSAPNTGDVTSVNALKSVLDETETRGWALDDEEHFEGVRCVAAGIRNAEGHMFAAISVSGPTVRLNDEKVEMIISVIQAKAAAISRQYGYLPTPAVESVG